MSEIDEIVGEFLVESYENLDRYDQDLLSLERDPRDAEALGSIFRTIHTLKGTCGFFGFARLEALAHVAENLLGRLREGELAVDEGIASVLLATGDEIRAMLADIETTGDEGPDERAGLRAELERLTNGGPSGHAEDDVDAAGNAALEGSDVDTPRDDRLGALLVDEGAVQPADVSMALHHQELGDDRPIGEILTESGAAEQDDIATALSGQAASRGVADSSIRVDVGLLDELMNVVGELVLARNQIVQLVGEEQRSELSSAAQRLSLITTELQEGVMKTRMQPIGNVWNKLPRVVRDLAVSCGKDVDLEMEGEDTELDKTIIEAIKDPLTHLVRNAVDHGLEAPEQRHAAGKSGRGTVRLRAFHEGGQVNIEIADDGAGIDVAGVRSKAVERGVVAPADASSMSDRDALQLIFEAGLSTAAHVTSVSGRGVGMDVVRTNIERIGGTIDVQTELGVGTTFKIKIPLTLAIIPALIVTSGGDRYAIPQLSLLELVRLEGERARSSIELVHGVPIYRLRGNLLPIVYLDEELGASSEPAREREVLSIVVLQADGHQFGLVVDEINDTEEIVVKPLGSRLKEATLFAGATIMGDGQVALILDVLGTAQRAHVIADGAERRRDEQPDEEVLDSGERRALLLVSAGADRRAAITLSDVARLEEIPADAVERGSGQEVVQYRDQILPLVRLSESLGVMSSQDKPTLDVVVHDHGGRHVGLVVDEIVDIVDEQVTVEQVARATPGVVGSIIVQGAVTDLVDVSTLLGEPVWALAEPVYSGA